MFIILYKIILCCIFLILGTGADKVISEEVRNDHKESRKDRNTYSVDKARRALDDADDMEWHVSHLRDIDFGPRRSGCKEETFEEKAQRYRKALQNDGALVEFVSADKLQVNEKEKQGDVCHIPEAIDRIFKFHNKSDKGEEKKAEKNETLNADTATTHSDGKAEKKDLRRHPGEYQFSSIEYYDEVPSFNRRVCPEAVIEVILQQEHIRNYDVQCELIVEWRSLE